MVGGGGGGTSCRLDAEDESELHDESGTNGEGEPERDFPPEVDWVRNLGGRGLPGSPAEEDSVKESELAKKPEGFLDRSPRGVMGKPVLVLGGARA